MQDNWKTQTCEGCRFRVGNYCRRAPALIQVAPIRLTNKIGVTQIKDEYNPACAEYQPEEEGD